MIAPPASGRTAGLLETQVARATVVEPEQGRDDHEGLAGWEWSLLLAGLSFGALQLMGGLLPWHQAIGFVDFPAGAALGCFAVFLGFLVLVRARYSPGLLLIALILGLSTWIALLPRLRPRPVPVAESPAAGLDAAALPLHLVQATPADGTKKKLDVAFVVETSEAMADRWPAVKAEILRAAENVRAKDPGAVLGLVTFRSKMVKGTKVLAEELPMGDALIPFTRDAGEFSRLVGNLFADGGGDTPESSMDALYLATQQPWRAKADKVLVLITDAPPRVPDRNMRNMEEVMLELKRKEIRQLHVMTDQYHYNGFYKVLHRDFKGQQFELRGAGLDFDKILTKVGTEIAELSLKQRGLTTRTVKNKTISVDILFALDLTGSMQREINGVRTGINTFARELLARSIDARIGLIGFRDQVEDPPSKVFEVLRFRQKPYRLEVPDTVSSVDIEVVAGDGLPGPGELRGYLDKVIPQGAAPEQSVLDALGRAARLPFRKEADKLIVLVAEGTPLRPDREILDAWHLAEILQEKGIRFLDLVVPAGRLPAYQSLLAALHGRTTTPGDTIAVDWVHVPKAPPVGTATPVVPETIGPKGIDPSPSPAETAPVTALPPGTRLARPGIGFWISFLGLSGMVGCFLLLSLCRPMDLGRSPRFGDLPRLLQLFAPFLGSLMAGTAGGLLWLAATRGG